MFVTFIDSELHIDGEREEKKTSNVEKMKKNIIDRQTHPTNGTTMGTCFDFEVPFS